MKILYIITKSNWGGAQRHVYDLSIDMKNRGHEVIVALGGDGVLRKKLEEASISTRPINTLGRDISAKRDVSSLKSIFSIIKREKPDILHLHSPKAAGFGSFAGRILGVKKIIYTVHGWAFNEQRPLSQKIGIIFFSWLTIMFSHRVVLLSEREYSQTLHFIGSKKKIILIPLGIHSPIFMSVDGSRQMLAKLIGTDFSELNKKTIIGTIAELHPNKGLNHLIAAMRTVVNDHPNTSLIIIGDGELKTSLHMQIKESELEKNIFLAGYIENASEYLKAFNIFTLSSIKEGLPYTILESAYASLPVVSTTVGGIPEIIEDMKTGVLVQPRNYREIAHAISFLIEHPAIRRTYGNALRESVMNKYPIEKMLNSLAELYQK